jgi:hypothetical protein
MPELTVDLALSLLGSVNLEELSAGTPIEWSQVGDPVKVIKVAVHCCINGPVGVDKSTTFPGVDGTFKIKSLFGSQKVGSTSWRRLCLNVAEAVNRLKPTLNCNTKSMNGGLWPIVEMKKKN